MVGETCHLIIGGMHLHLHRADTDADTDANADADADLEIQSHCQFPPHTHHQKRGWPTIKRT